MLEKLMLRALPGDVRSELQLMFYHVTEPS